MYLCNYDKKEMIACQGGTIRWKRLGIIIIWMLKLPSLLIYLHRPNGKG
jgi:hypothetical protein